MQLDRRTTPRDLPQVAALLATPALSALATRFSRDEVVEALRGRLNLLRAEMLGGENGVLPDFTGAAFVGEIEAGIVERRRPALRPLVNATGILIHTNLGRARLAPEALRQMQCVGGQAVNLEFDLGAGTRGSRGGGAEALICRLTGAEAALIVNNCAAAVLLALTGLAAGRSVIASRGELIEIGGAFRLPDVIAQSGARLREVGTTNRTRIGDYARSVDDDTAVLLKSHPSNYRISGFTGAPTRAELAELASARGVILVEDLGSGILIDLTAQGLGEEPVVADVLRSGVDLAMFSGDKLLGGPQAGILAGRAQVIEGLRAHPLFRALRADKLVLAGLEATLRLYLPPHEPLRDIPVLRMLAAPMAELRARAETLVAQFGAAAHVIDSAAQVGAGAMPQKDLPSVAVALAFPGEPATALAARLRAAEVPVVGRIREGRVLLDMRSIENGDLPAIRAALAA